MDKTTLRKQLLANITSMCNYAEQHLANVANDFCYEYERGFIYGHKCDRICFFFSATKKKAMVVIHHYGTTIYMHNNIVEVRCGGEKNVITNSYLTNTTWCTAQEIQEAMTISQGLWQTIKMKIEKHKSDEDEILNFQL